MTVARRIIKAPSARSRLAISPNNDGDQHSFREIDLNHDGFIQESEALAFKQHLRDELAKIAGDSKTFDTPEKFKAMENAGYSNDRLISILNALEVDVEIVIRPRSIDWSHGRGSVRIMEVVS